MRNFAQSVSVMGRVISSDPEKYSFQVQARSGDLFPAFVNVETQYQALRNLDELDADRFIPPDVPKVANDKPDPRAQIEKYIIDGSLIIIEGVYQESGPVRRIDVRTVRLLTQDATTNKKLDFGPDRFLFETTHWWLTQIDRLGNQWLEELFGSKMAYEASDFSLSYLTNLNILGQPTDDNVQEMATLSRLIYGLSTAYLLTGTKRFMLAAKAGIEFQQETFRYLTHDGKYCFWAFGRRQGRNGSKLIVPSQNPDDLNTIPLYEQIYALAGMAQYYRITSNREVLDDIRRTVRMMNAFYLDRATETNGFPGLGGYFSHIDYATMRPDTPALGKNQSRKNWNSNGDHIPAYLINLILALDPLPKDCDDELREFVNECVTMLETCAKIVLDKFPDPSSLLDPHPTEGIPYVNERFYANWKPDHEWGWQQNRAIVGHNLKIAWNLTRVAKYFLTRAARADLAGERFRPDLDPPERTASQVPDDPDRRFAKELIEYSKKLAEAMAERGYDQIRGGLYDAVEREPKNELPIEFTWMDTKDFWQQEQGILAYLILQSVTPADQRVDPSRLKGSIAMSLRDDFKELAREMQAFWNLYFLDHDNRGIYQRAMSIGIPVIQGNYGNKGAHSISGYHAYELNYLAHIYNRALISKPPQFDNNFTLYFHPEKGSRQLSINVLPEFFAPAADGYPDEIEITRVSVRGVDRPELAGRARNNRAQTPYQISLLPDELDSDVVVEFNGNPRN